MYPFRLFVFLFCTCGVLLCTDDVVFAQKGKKKPVQETKKGPAASTDTVIIYKKELPEEKPSYISAPSSSMRSNVTIIRPSDTVDKPKPLYKDTVYRIKKPRPAGVPKPLTEEEKIVEINKHNNFCACVQMDIKTSTILQYETYLDYTFIFKNNCKIDVWVSSKHFRFTPYNTFNKPVKVLRKLSFVQRYDHPAFVKIEPGETYSFHYGDDAFFEYDLRKGETYKFIFEHRNFGVRSKIAPEKTYLCGQKRVQMITVK